MCAFYAAKDVALNKFLIGNNNNPQLSELEREQVTQRDLSRLRDMVCYCSATECLRCWLLRYFGESAEHPCGNCGNCASGSEAIDVTTDAQRLFECVRLLEQNRRSYGIQAVSDLLRGERSDTVLRGSLERLPCFGCLSELRDGYIKALIDYMISRRFLSRSVGEFPCLHSGKAAPGQSGERLLMRIKPHERSKAAVPAGEQDGLYKKLLALRSAIAAEEHTPAYIIFSNRSLHDMCRLLPANEEEFLGVSGVGEYKAKKYGARFTALIREHSGGE